jgi:chemotaxis protein methyltransferase CheR
MPPSSDNPREGGKGPGGVMSAQSFSRLANFIESELGIKMPPAKRTMLQSRLQKRLRLMGFNSFEPYLNFVFSPEGRKEELVALIDSVTTNKTDFFRESKHFDFLTQTALPELIRHRSAGLQKPVAFWSAGCSTGEEPYTLAMVLSEFAAGLPGFDFSILATDISSRVLEKASQAIYDEERVIPVAESLKKKYLLRSRDHDKGLVRVVPELRRRVRFHRLNFMSRDFGVRTLMDVIFCRNVIIYFDRPTQEGVLNRLCAHLAPGGFVFMGHSETLSGLDVPLVPVATTVYRKAL